MWEQPEIEAKLYYRPYEYAYILSLLGSMM